MSASPADPKGDPQLSEVRGRGIMIARLFCVLFYLLSPGPLSRAYQLGIASEYLVFRCPVWAPLDWLCRVAAVKAFYDWYLPLWDIAENPPEKVALQRHHPPVATFYFTP
jgi:hypothetical protein